MDTFEKQFETMDITSEYMENAIGQTTALTTPDEEVMFLEGVPLFVLIDSLGSLSSFQGLLGLLLFSFQVGGRGSQPPWGGGR